MIRRVRIGLAVAALLIGLLAGCELLIGFPRFVDGKWVRRVTIWHAYSMALPIPYQRGTVYHRGWAIYENGQVHYYNEQIYEGDRLVAWKRYEGGRWFVAVPSGVGPRFRINPSTGALERVTP